MSLTRTIKFEIIFPGLRKHDRLELYRRLWGVSSDLTRASNKLIGALFLIQQGMLEHPVRDNGKKVPIQTLAYQGLSGAWQPYGHPMYTPYEGKNGTNPKASGGVMSETANTVLTRLKTDFIDVVSGKKSLATFRELPVSLRRSEVSIDEQLNLELTVFGGRRNNRVRVRPRRLDDGSRTILRRIIEGRYKHGSARLSWKQRKGARGKWVMSLSWTDEQHVAVPVTDTSLIAAVDLGIEHAVWMSYVDMAGNPRRFNDTIEFPGSIIRSVQRMRRERKQRSVLNRADFGLRTGRGRSRKLRVVEHLGDGISRAHDTMIKQLAAATVNKAIARGATVLTLEDHKDWSVERMHAEADEASKKQAARLRRNYFRWHQGAMRTALEHAAEKQGLTVVVVDPAWSSRTCYSCGTVYRDTGIYRSGPRPEGPEYGRIELRKFRCACGVEVHADRNAAINLARSGLETVLAQQASK